MHPLLVKTHADIDISSDGYMYVHWLVYLNIKCAYSLSLINARIVELRMRSS